MKLKDVDNVHVVNITSFLTLAHLEDHKSNNNALEFEELQTGGRQIGNVRG